MLTSKMRYMNIGVEYSDQISSSSVREYVEYTSPPSAEQLFVQQLFPVFLYDRRAVFAPLFSQTRLSSSYLARQCAVPGQEEVADMADHDESAELHKRLNLCGVHLRRFRLEKHLTLTDLQAALELDYGIHLDRTNLGRIENGERTVSDVELVVFSHLLNISVEHLLWGDSLPDANVVRESLKNIEMRYATRYPTKKQKH